MSLHQYSYLARQAIYTGAAREVIEQGPAETPKRPQGMPRWPNVCMLGDLVSSDSDSLPPALSPGRSGGMNLRGDASMKAWESLKSCVYCLDSACAPEGEPVTSSDVLPAEAGL
jgi:hypothetical protein